MKLNMAFLDACIRRRSQVGVLFFVLTFVFLIKLAWCEGQSPQSRGAIASDASVLYSKMHQASSLTFRNAVGWYVVRRYSSTGKEKRQLEIQELEKALKADLAARVERDKKFGVETDIEAIERENAKALEGYAVGSVDTETRIERYTIQGRKFLIEKLPVSNDLSLSDIREQVLSEAIDFSAPSVLAWNGELTAEIGRANNATSDAQGVYGMVNYEKLGTQPDFMTFGRDAVARDFTDKFLESGLPITAESYRRDGELIAQLRIGHPQSAGLQIEINTLPEKGYVVASSRIKQGGAVVVSDDYEEFHQVSDYGWMPTKVTRSNYQLDKLGVPSLRTKLEMLAIKPLSVNASLPEGYFDLAKSDRFKSLPQITKNQGTRQTPEELLGQTIPWIKYLFIGLNFVIILVMLVFYVRKKRRSSIAGALLMLIVGVTMAGCDNEKGEFGCEAACAIMLLEDRLSFASGEKQVSVTAPPGTGIEQQLKICSPTLARTAMTVTTTCGCAFAELSKDCLAAGGKVNLNMSFDPSAVTGGRQVNALLRCKEMPFSGIKIPISYSIDKTLSGWRLKASPAEFVIDGFWTNDCRREFVSTLECGNLIDLDRLEISRSSKSIKVFLEELNVEGDSKYPTVRLETGSLPVGSIDESITIKYPLGNRSYYAKIFIRGAILPPFKCKPASIIAKQGENGVFPQVFIDVIRADGSSSSGLPEIDVLGDWVIDKISQESPTHWQVGLTPITTAAGETIYGLLVVKGDWQGSLVKVPLTAVRSPDPQITYRQVHSEVRRGLAYLMQTASTFSSMTLRTTAVLPTSAASGKTMVGGTTTSTRR